MASLKLLPGVANLTVPRGDVIDLPVTITEDGSPVELSTSGWVGQIRTTKEATEVAATITIDAENGADGVVLLSFQLDNVGRYVYDVECDSRTWIEGSITVVSDVTR